MTNLELVLNMLAETATTEISGKSKPKGLVANKEIARQGGSVAKNARQEIEARTGQEIISKKTAKTLQDKTLKKLN